MGREETMYGLFDHLRSNDPIAWVEHPDYRPFWALTRYDDMKAIGSANDEFLSAPRTVLVPEEAEKMFLETFGTPNGLETLIHMDRPKHASDLKRVAAAKKRRPTTNERKEPQN